MPIEVLATNHTSFTVSSLDRAVRLFADGLGFELRSRAFRDPAAIAAITGVPGAEVEIAFLRRPDHTVELIEYRGPADRAALRARPCDTGFAHLAFDVGDLDGAIAELAGHNVTPIADPVRSQGGGPNAGARVVYLRDPDGITIELIEKAPK